MKRAPTRPAKDEKIFRNTATKTKAINVSPKVSRGGTRL